MSMVFTRDPNVRQKVSPNHSTVQKLLDENSALIQTIVEYQNVGRVPEAAELQQTLHRNLMYLASLADGGQSLMAELQAPLDENATASSQQSYQPAVPAEGQVVAGDKENRPPQMLNPEQTRFQAPAGYPAQPVPSGSYYSENQGPPPQAHQQPAQQAHGQSPAMPAQQMQQQQYPQQQHPQQQQQMQQMSALQQQLQQPSSTASSGPVPGAGQPMTYSQPQMQMGQPPQQQYYPQQYQQQTGPQPPQTYQSQQAYQQGVRPPSQQQQNDPAAMAYYNSQARYQQQFQGGPMPQQQQGPHPMHYQQPAGVPANYQPQGPGGSYGQHMRPMGYPQQGPGGGPYSQPQQMGPPSQPPTSDAQQHPAYHANQPYSGYQPQQQQQPHMGPPPPQNFSSMPNQ